MDSKLFVIVKTHNYVSLLTRHPELVSGSLYEQGMLKQVQQDGLYKIINFNFHKTKVKNICLQFIS